MSHNWVLDVIADLTAYARKNDLRGLAEHLSDARLVAVEEIGRADIVLREGAGPRRVEDAARTRGAL